MSSVFGQFFICHQKSVDPHLDPDAKADVEADATLSGDVGGEVDLGAGTLSFSVVETLCFLQELDTPG